MKYNLNIFYLLLLLFFFSYCKPKEKQEVNIEECAIDLDSGSSTSTKDVAYYLRDLVLSSNLDFEDFPKNQIVLYAEESFNCADFGYPFRVMIENGQSQVGSFTLGIIYYNPIKKELYDVSSSLRFPKKLTYDKKIEEDLLQKITETCGVIPKYIQPKQTILPFNMGEWANWYDKQEYNNLPEKNNFNYYKVADDYILLTSILNIRFHEGLVPYLYFELCKNENYSALLLFSRYKDDEYPALGIQDKFYDIITIRKDSIISYLDIGYVPYTSREQAKSFNIDKNLTIKVYTELMCSDDLRIPCDTLNTSTYQIKDNGIIEEIE